MKNFDKISQKRLVFVVLILVATLGVVFRLYKLDAQSYWIDEGFTINAAQATLQHGYPVLASGFKYTRSILNTYIIAGTLKLFGNNPWAARISTVVFGTLFILLIYVFVKKIFEDSRLALISALLTAFSNSQIAWSRQARMYIQFEFFFFAALLAFWLCIKRFTVTRFILTIALTVAAIFSHEFGLFLIGIYILIYILYVWGPFADNRDEQLQVQRKIKSNTARFFWIIFGAMAIVAPLAGLKFYQLFLVRFIGEDFGGQEKFIAGTFFYLFGHLFLLIILVAVIGVLGFVVKNKNLFPLVFVVTSFFLPFFLIAFSTDLLHLRYFIFLLPFLFVAMAFFCVYLADFLSIVIKLTPVRGTVMVIVIAIVIMVLGSQNFVFWPRTYYALEYGSPLVNFAAGYKAIKTLGWNNDTKIISPYPAMDKIYLGRSDYWLPISLSGKEEEIAGVNQSIYTGAPRIDTFDKLKNTYLLLDSMALSRLTEDQGLRITTSFQRVFQSSNLIVFKTK